MLHRELLLTSAAAPHECLQSLILLGRLVVSSRTEHADHPASGAAGGHEPAVDSRISWGGCVACGRIAEMVSLALGLPYYTVAKSALASRHHGVAEASTVKVCQWRQ